MKINSNRLLFFLLVSFVSTNIIAAPKGQGISSCYQKIEIGDAAEYTFLHGTFYQFHYTGVPNVQYWKIDLWDWEGAPLDVDYDDMGLLSEGHHVFNGKVSAKYNLNGVWHFNTNTFLLDPAAKGMTITRYYFTNGVLEEGQQTFLNLKTKEEVFEFENILGDCFTFDQFAIRWTTLLDGLCNPPVGSLKSVPPLWPGWPQYDEDINWFTTTTIPKPADYCQDTCGNVTAPSTIPDPVPCGCITYHLELTLTPCAEMPQGEPTQYIICPDLTWTVPIEICCTCDVRETPPAN